ncbi:MAG: hypothetical protein ACI35P_06550 [Bacillus sp. (in: firmicutes)]
MAAKTEKEVIQERLSYLINEMNRFLYREYNLTLKVPVLVNPRMKTTNGWVKYSRDPYSKKILFHTIQIEFNKSNLLNRSLEYNVGTALHEAVHYACMVRGKPHRDGDAYFESELKRLGLPSNYGGGRSDGRKQEDRQSMRELYKGKMFHYCVCKQCGGYIQHWKRKPSEKELRNLRRYQSRCCRAPIVYKGEIPAEKVLNRLFK